VYETSNKPNKIGLKALNPHISKDEGLNCPKFRNGLIPKFTES